MSYLIDFGIWFGVSLALAIAVCRATRECARPPRGRVKPPDEQQSQPND